MLSYIKIGRKEFYLQVGDKFTSNQEGIIYYYPSTRENQEKLPFRVWSRDDCITLPKRLHKQFLNASNIEQVHREERHEEELRYIEWKVTDIDSNLVIDKPDWGELYYIGIKKSTYLAEGDLFTIKKAKIEEDHEKQLFLKGGGLGYKNRILKSEIGKIQSDGRFLNSICSYKDQYAVLCYFDDFDKFRDELYAKANDLIHRNLTQAVQSFNAYNKKFEQEGFESKKVSFKIEIVQ